MYDHRVDARVLRHARTDAECIDVGAAAPQPLEQEAIRYLLAEKAREGRTIARLKWGDPFFFDHGGSEALFLHEQGVPFEVVPGVPAGVAAPAYAGVPVTYPGGGDTVTFVRGGEGAGPLTASVDWASLARLDGTIVCYAGPDQVAPMLEALVAHGRAAGETAALVYDGTLPTQRTLTGTLVTLADQAREAGDRRLRDPRRRARRVPARAPPLVRRAAALRPPRARHPRARQGRRPRRTPDAGRRRDRGGLDDPD